VRIWVTRTQPKAEVTADLVRRLGHEAVVEPLLAQRPIPGARLDLSGAAALAFTSQNAVNQFAALCRRRDLPVFAVGKSTAAVARRVGFAEVASADGAVEDLAALILAARPAGRVVVPAVREPAGDLLGPLAAAGIEAELQPIYETYEAAWSLPGFLDGVMLASPTAGKVLAARLQPAQAGALRLYALSPACAAPLKDLPFEEVRIAERPNETALLALLQP
jgi:uroporphyrinogen-III synthase